MWKKACPDRHRECWSSLAESLANLRIHEPTYTLFFIQFFKWLGKSGCKVMVLWATKSNPVLTVLTSWSKKFQLRTLGPKWKNIVFLMILSFYQVCFCGYQCSFAVASLLIFIIFIFLQIFYHLFTDSSKQSSWRAGAMAWVMKKRFLFQRLQFLDDKKC